MMLQRYNPGLEQSNFPKVLQKSKGNQEFHQELQMKADELDKLFATHQLHAQSSRTASLVLEKQLNPNMNIVELGRLNSDRGKSYDRYTQIRDAKLRGQSDSVRVLNDEKMKVMSQRLQHIRDVMMFSSADYFDQQESGRISLDELRSSSMHIIENTGREKQLIKLQDDYDSTRSLNSNDKLTHSKTLSSSVSRSSAPPPIPRSSSKDSSIGRRRIAPENAGDHSLPIVSDFKEPNTKQTNRLQFAHIPRSKSINVQKPTIQKDDISRSRSIRKSSPSNSESKDSSSSNLRSDNAKPFLRKGSGIGPGAGSGIAKQKAGIESDNVSSEEESPQMADKREDSASMIKNAGTRNIPTDFYIGNSRLKQESERSAIPNSDDIVILKLNSQVKPDLATEVTSAPLTLYTPVRQLQESPVQSPVSWTARMHFPFSSSPKRSDTDVSIGSPMSWNSKSLTHLETDSPPTRKKWGDVKKEARSFFSLSSFRSKGSDSKHRYNH